MIMMTSCSSFTPTRYGQTVIVVQGEYKGEFGRLIKDCSGFEKYIVHLSRLNKEVCIHIWNLEGL